MRRGERKRSANDRLMSPGTLVVVSDKPIIRPYRDIVGAIALVVASTNDGIGVDGYADCPYVYICSARFTGWCPQAYVERLP